MYGLALPALATLFANLATASIDLGWKMPNASSSMKEITFPISMNGAPHMDGYYFAQQFAFEGISDVAYTGLQPRKSSNGASIVHVAFSSFIEGTESDDDLCSGGTDGSSTGVSCKKDIVGSYSHPYNITVKNVKGTTWEGTLVDAATKNSTHVGLFTLPSKAGGITTSNTGFVEYFPWNSGGDKSCDSLPYFQAAFGNPWSSELGQEGIVKKPTQSGDCSDKTGFTVKAIKNGYVVSNGNKDAIE